MKKHYVSHLQNQRKNTCNYASNWIGNEGFWVFELACEECGKSAAECLKSDDVACVCKHFRKGECDKNQCAQHYKRPPRKRKKSEILA